jgi:hypothetical protein
MQIVSESVPIMITEFEPTEGIESVCVGAVVVGGEISVIKVTFEVLQSEALPIVTLPPIVTSLIDNPCTGILNTLLENVRILSLSSQFTALAVDE